MSGLPLALRVARHGTTAFVERELLGGSCLNRGCIPTKTMIHEAVIAMVGDIPYRDIGRAIHVHPTLAEGVNTAAGGVHRPSG